ncbi:MAG: HD family phosphohydrolase [Candidatus Kapaibacterium sp.]
MANNQQTLFQKLVNQKNYEPEEDTSNPRYSWKFRILIMLGTITICAAFFIFRLDETSSESFEYNLTPNFVWPGNPVVAEFSFPIYKPEKDYRADVDSAVNSALPIFIHEESIAPANFSKIDRLRNQLFEITVNEASASGTVFNEGSLEELIRLSPPQASREINDISNVVKKYLESSYRSGFINISKNQINTTEIIVRIDNDKRKILPTVDLTDENSFLMKAEKALADDISPEFRALALEMIQDLSEPNLIFSEELTNKHRQLVIDAVPRTTGFVKEGEMIVKENQRLTESTIAKLKSYQKSKYLISESAYTFTNVLGNIGHVFIIYGILIIYLFFLRKKIFFDNQQLAIVGGILVLASLLAWLSLAIQSTFPLEYLILVPAFSMLGAIVFDSRTAFYITVSMAFMVAGIRGNDYQTGLIMLFTGTLAAYSVRDIQNRTQMFQSILFIFIGFLLAITAFGLERSAEFLITLKRSSLALINSAVSPLVTFGLLFLLERVTSVTTDLKLQEYDKLNHPLLLKMNDVAPGTYQHTLSVAMLAERCADAIGANTLLTKVGTYFHDIGKISKAEYFTENQMDIENKHDLIPPKKSAQAIKEHVVDGVHLAKQYKLPKRIIDFIPMHHGTTLIKHFYAKALEEASDPLTVQESDFRYPGPKPNSKETAILMICDSAEAISRIEVESKEELENMIDANIKDRIFDGQFDESDITLHEIQIIKQTLAKNLFGKSHQRVKYKEIPKEKEG